MIAMSSAREASISLAPCEVRSSTYKGIRKSYGSNILGHSTMSLIELVTVKSLNPMKTCLHFDEIFRILTSLLSSMLSMQCPA